MDVWGVVLRLAAGAGLGDRVALAHGCAFPNSKRAEMGERGPVAVGRDDGDGQAVGRNRPCEGHLAGGGRPNQAAVADTDVDAAMLPGCVPIVRERETAENRPVGRPVPGPRGVRAGERRDRHAGDTQNRSRCPSSEHRSTVARARSGCHAIDGLVTKTRGRARCERHPSAARPPRQPSAARHRPRRGRRRRLARRRPARRQLRRQGQAPA